MRFFSIDWFLFCINWHYPNWTIFFFLLNFDLFCGCKIGEDKDLSVMASVQLKKVFANKKVRNIPNGAWTMVHNIVHYILNRVLFLIDIAFLLVFRLRKQQKWTSLLTKEEQKWKRRGLYGKSKATPEKLPKWWEEDLLIQQLWWLNWLQWRSEPLSLTSIRRQLSEDTLINSSLSCMPLCFPQCMYNC